MNETRAILRAAATLSREGKPVIVATVVRVRGSSYRRPGARMVMSDERWLAGSVSGGCLEADVVRKADWRTQRGATVVTYDSTNDDHEGFALGCGGVVDVLLERV